MGDSDDEYDRRRRDKFRRERSDYDRSREREDRRRDEWNERYVTVAKNILQPEQFSLTGTNICLASPYYCLLNSIFSGSGTGVGSGVVEESTGIMREDAEKDSRHQDMTWVPSRNAWEGSGMILSTDSFKLIWSPVLLQVKKNVPIRDDHGGDPYRGGYDMGFGGGGGPSYGPPQHWGHPDLHLMQPHHGIPIQAR